MTGTRYSPRTGLWLLGLAAAGGCISPRAFDDTPMDRVMPHEYSSAAYDRMSPYEAPTPAPVPVAAVEVEEPPAEPLPKFAVPQVTLATHLQGPALQAPKPPASQHPTEATFAGGSRFISGLPTPATPTPATRPRSTPTPAVPSMATPQEAAPRAIAPSVLNAPPAPAQADTRTETKTAAAAPSSQSPLGYALLQPPEPRASARPATEPAAADPPAPAPSRQPTIRPAAPQVAFVPEVPATPVSMQPTPAQTPVQAAPPAAPPLTLEAIQQLALENNPTIRQLSASAEGASALREQVGLRANPTIGYNAMQLADEGTDQHTLFVEQQFVTAGKLDLNRNVLGHAVEAWRWDVEAQRHRVRTDVRLRFLEALAAQQRLEEIDEFLKVARQGADLAQRRFEAQETSRADLLQAQIQLNEAEIMREQAHFAWQSAWQGMTATAGVPQLPVAPLAGSLDVGSEQLNWEIVYAELLGHSPELQAAQRRVSQARSNLSRQEIQAIPNLITSLEAGHDNGTGSGMINVSIGAPIPVFNANQGNISAAYAEFCRATHEVKRTELSLRNRLAEVARQYDSARIATERYDEQVLPKAQQTLDLAEQAYGAGEYSFLQVLVVRRTYFDAHLRAIEARQQLAQAHAQIDGLLLTGGLDAPAELEMDDSLRGLTLGQE